MGERSERDTDLDHAGQAEIEGRKGRAEGGTGPAAGPHAAPSLTNDEATPGAGSLPSPAPGDEADAGTG